MDNQKPFFISDWQNSLCIGESMGKWGIGIHVVRGKSMQPL